MREAMLDQNATFGNRGLSWNMEGSQDVAVRSGDFVGLPRVTKAVLIHIVPEFAVVKLTFVLDELE